MTFSDNTPRAKRTRCDESNLWVELTDGRQIGVPLAYFPRLLAATPGQREKVVMSGGGTGLHWEDIDEDISVPGLLASSQLIIRFKPETGTRSHRARTVVRRRTAHG